MPDPLAIEASSPQPPHTASASPWMMRPSCYNKPGRRMAIADTKTSCVLQHVDHRWTFGEWVRATVVQGWARPVTLRVIRPKTRHFSSPPIIRRTGETTPRRAMPTASGSARWHAPPSRQASQWIRLDL